MTSQKRNGCDPDIIKHIKPIDQNLLSTMSRLEKFSFKDSSSKSTIVNKIN